MVVNEWRLRPRVFVLALVGPSLVMVGLAPQSSRSLGRILSFQRNKKGGLGSLLGLQLGPC